VQPPLSVRESCQMLKQIIVELEGKPGPQPARIEQLDRMLHAINFYIDRLDRTNTALPQYTWDEIISRRVTDTNWQTIAFELKTPIDNVSGIALKAHHGDIQLSQLIAIDENGVQWAFDQPMLMTDGEAHVEICLLPLPTRLKQLKLTCRQMVEKPTRYPRLIVEVGISPEPEYPRQARHFLQQGRAEIAKKPRQSAASLRKTFDLLQSFEQAKME
jgi:hypothetical protein